MSKLSLFYNFRVRLLLLMTGLMVATLGVQYYIERHAQRGVARLIAEQEQALARSTSLALESLASTKYLEEIDAERRTRLLERFAGRVVNVLMVNEEGRVDDSLDPKFKPRTLEDNSAKYFHISEVGLPKLAGSGPGMTRLRQLLPGVQAMPEGVAGEPRAIPIVLRTTKGVNYIIIVLGAASRGGENPLWDSVEPLLPTLAVLLVTTFATSVLFWRFLSPISELSRAAQMAAAGHYDFRVAAARRRDEIGALASTFNEMLDGLKHARELEAQLHRAERSAVVGRIASAVAHEIKNPLNYINLALDHLRTAVRPQDEGQRGVFVRLTDQIKCEVGRINRRIVEFLRYSRPSALELKPLDPRPILEDAVRMIEMEAAEKGVEVEVEQAAVVPEVLGDAEALRSAFTNLLINALHATGEGGRIKAALSAEVGRVRVEVSDTGVGIAPENVPHVFEPYFSTKETGTGLGLAIAKKAVEDHRGTIAVESLHGEGTTFTVTLPAGNEGERDVMS